MNRVLLRDFNTLLVYEARAIYGRIKRTCSNATFLRIVWWAKYIFFKTKNNIRDIERFFFLFNSTLI